MTLSETIRSFTTVFIISRGGSASGRYYSIYHQKHPPNKEHLSIIYKGHMVLPHNKILVYFFITYE